MISYSEGRMKKLLGLMVLLVCAGGCFFEEHDGRRHHGREAGVEAGHAHCYGCGHVQVKGVWYVQN
jgi:hypothetical protein